MDLRALRYFSEIVRYGSFGKAAEGIPLSQPALSKSIHLLEDELGVSLLERGRRGVGVKTTAAGEIVLRHARTMLQERDALVAELDSLRGLKQGKLQIGLPPLGSAEVFARFIADYRERYPAIEVQLREEGSEGLEQAVRSGEIEIAATLLPVRPDLHSLFVIKEPMMLAVPRHHPLARRKRIRIAELNGVPFIVLEGGFVLNRMVRDACAASGFSLLEAARSAQPDFALALVAAGVGVMCLPRLVAERHANDGVRLVQMEGSALDWQVALVWRKGTELSYAATAWLELIQAAPPVRG